MNKLKILLLALSLPAFASNNIFDKMDKETAVTTGIYKLSQEELAELTQWIENTDKNNRTESREVLKQEIRTQIIEEDLRDKVVKEEIIRKDKIKNMGFRKEEAEREEIHTAVIGEFNGWRGKNVFKLENGQVWVQSEKSTFYIPKRPNPNITIKPKSMNTWSLYVDGFGRGVKVKRIK